MRSILHLIAKPLALILVVAALLLVYIYLNQKPFDRGFNANSMQSGLEVSPVRILTVGDPFAFALQRMRSRLIENGTPPFELAIMPYVATYSRIRSDSRDRESAYHWVSFDVVWLPQLVAEGALSPIGTNDWERLGMTPSDYSSFSLELNRVGDRLFGLPIQPHTELLWYRRDILSAANIEVPTTPQALLEAAHALQDPSRQLYGVAWNAHRGQALGQTVAHLLGAFGAPLGSEVGLLRLDQTVALEVAHFLRDLLAVSPPDILTMAWDQRIERFARGHVVFVYGWTARIPMVELDPLSEVQGKVGYTFPPMAPGVELSLPVGQWSIGLPANLPADQRQRSLEWMRAIKADDNFALWTHPGFSALMRLWTIPGRGFPILRYRRSWDSYCKAQRRRVISIPESAPPHLTGKLFPRCWVPFFTICCAEKSAPLKP
ncbi:MAG: extracellular solute-binding protein [Verrucomicrobia bacterium]|nr:extracellular solute-binding protein [Verrucomicrobiota bacterium]